MLPKVISKMWEESGMHGYVGLSWTVQILLRSEYLLRSESGFNTCEATPSYHIVSCGHWRSLETSFGIWPQWFPHVILDYSWWVSMRFTCCRCSTYCNILITYPDQSWSRLFHLRCFSFSSTQQRCRLVILFWDMFALILTTRIPSVYRPYNSGVWKRTTDGLECWG